MAQLYLNDQEINTVFGLLGDKENDITFSLGWALAQSGVFLARFLKDLFPEQNTGKATNVHLQKHGKEQGGYTDIEIETEIAHVIVEAKRGWNLPTEAQLKRYAPRFGKRRRNAILIVAQREPTGVKLPKPVNSVRIHYRSWKQITQLALRSVGSGNNAEKQLLRQFAAYMEGMIDMQKQKSNMVYVIALGGRDKQYFSGKPWRDHVIQSGFFHQSVDERWPSETPNYLGFRWDGKLQSIHHVEDYKIVSDLYKHVPVLHRQGWMEERRHLCKLGPAIKPTRDVRSTGLQHGRVNAAIDLLLTCKTILEAHKKTNKRLEALET